jgi:hypothetical protein
MNDTARSFQSTQKNKNFPDLVAHGTRSTSAVRERRLKLDKAGFKLARDNPTNVVHEPPPTQHEIAVTVELFGQQIFEFWSSNFGRFNRFLLESLSMLKQ